MYGPLVSVLMKTYNHAAYIGQAIESILSQSFSDFELLVIDDASTDGTLEVAKKFADPRIKLRALPVNGGISNAMNIGLSLAQGEFVATQNSDDFSLPHRLERQVEYLEAHPEASAVFCHPLQVDAEGRAIPGLDVLNGPQEMADYSRESWLRRFFFHGNCIGPTGMAHRSAYRAVGLYDRRLTNLQDLDMWVRLAAIGELHFMPEPLVVFRIWEGQTSAPNRKTHIRSQYEFYRVLLRYLDLDAAFLRRIFSADIDLLGLGAETGAHHLVAHLALAADLPPHKLLAMQVLFDRAISEADFQNLRELSGRINVFGIRLGEAPVLKNATAPPAVDAGRDMRGLRLFADNKSHSPTISGSLARFEIAEAPSSMRLVSRTYTPIEHGANADTRDLGILVGSLKIIDQSGAIYEIDISDPGFENGFHRLESEGEVRWRWTDGEARLPESIWKNCTFPVSLVINTLFMAAASPAVHTQGQSA